MKSKLISLLCLTTAFASTPSPEDLFAARMKKSQEQAQVEGTFIRDKRLAREKMVADESLARQNLQQDESIERSGLWDKTKIYGAVEQKTKILDEEELWRYNFEKQLKLETDEWRSLNDDLRRKYIVEANYVNTDPKFIILTTGEGKYTKHVRVRRDLCKKYFSTIKQMIDDEEEDKTNIVLPIDGNASKQTLNTPMANPGGQTPAPLIHLMEWLEKFDAIQLSVAGSDDDETDPVSVAAIPMLRMTPNLIHLAKYLGFICETCKEAASQVFVTKMTDYLLDPQNVKLVEDVPHYPYKLAIKSDPGKAFLLDNWIKTRSIKLVNNNLAEVINPDYAVRDKESRFTYDKNEILLITNELNPKSHFDFSGRQIPNSVKTIIIHSPNDSTVNSLLNDGKFESIIFPDSMSTIQRYDFRTKMLENCPNLKEIWVKRGSVTAQSLRLLNNYHILKPLIRYLGEDESKVHNFLIDHHSKPSTELGAAAAAVSSEEAASSSGAAPVAAHSGAAATAADY